MTEERMEKELTGYPSIDKPWLKYFEKELLEKTLPKRTVFQTIYENNKDYLRDTALIYFGAKISYDKLFNNIEMVTKALIGVGVQQGEVVNLCTAATPEAIYLMLACNRIGAIANFINPLFSKEQMTDRLRETGSQRVFVLDALYPKVEESLKDANITEIIIISVAGSMPFFVRTVSGVGKTTREILKRSFSENTRIISWNDFLQRGKEEYLEDALYKEETSAIMVYSSGSTGASKGIVLTNDGINATIANYERDSFYGKRTDTFLAMIPVWFSTGIVLSVLMPIAHGVTVILEPVFSKETFAKDLKKYKPTMTLTATSLWLYVATAKETQNIDLSRMNYPSTGGEKISEQDEKLLDNFLLSHHAKSKLLKGYGMCELGSEVCGTTVAKGYSSKPLGVGYPVLGATVSAFDPITNIELKYGEHGEIRVCSPAKMKGYFKNPEATSEYFWTDENGMTWGCTGDIGYVDEDGEVFILGRKTDSATLENGDHVYLFDIEDVILRDPNLSGCKVVAVEDEGKTVLAAHITLRQATADATKLIRQIDKLCHQSLPDAHCPVRYKIRDSFPVHPNGKRDVGALKQEKDGFILVGKMKNE
ncbi:MAG: acyl--CoA ligase [Lachnospiraceae bacterium]|nr:acyl--CoA ligase [Lachnospiraceae bacterium]